MKDSALRTGIVTILTIGTLLLTLTSFTLGDDDDDAAVAPQSPQPSQSATTNDPAIDSVYAEINSSFQAIKPTVAGACYDCHSDKTDYPWYHSLPIIGGWMDGHIEKGKRHIDMTNGFPFATRMPPANSLEEIKEQIEESEMPIWSYRLMHSSARLSDAQKDSIYTWVTESLKLLKAKGVTPVERRGRRAHDED